MSYRTPRSRLLQTVAFAAVLMIGQGTLAAPVAPPNQVVGDRPATDTNAASALRLPSDSLLSVDMNRIEIVDKIMAQWKTEMNADVASTVLEKLKGLRADKLLAASLVGSFDDVLKVLVASEKSGANTALVNNSSVSADRSKTVGSTASDLAYTPITPKRMVDTRGVVVPTCFAGGGVYANNEIRSYTITSGGCISAFANASAIQVQLYAAPANGTVVDLYADRQGGSLAAVALEAVGVPSGAFSGTGVTIPINTTNDQFSIKVVNVPTHVIVDVVGYFSAPTQISVASATTGVTTYSSNSGSTGYAIYGFSSGAGGRGVVGQSTDTANGYGVWGYNPGGTAVRADGNITTNGVLDFGSQTRQMIQLWGGVNAYGIGIQGGTQYYRVDAGSSNTSGFAWFRGGVHNDAAFAPGTGGISVMTLSRDGQLVLPQSLQQQIRLGDSAAGGDVMGIGAQNYTTYVRVPDTGAFSVYKNGTHVISECNPGTGGEVLSTTFKTGNASLCQSATVTGTVRAVNFVATSDRAAKFGFEAVNAKAILAKVASLPISTWMYNAEKGAGVRHIGPVAQDFRAAFNLGQDDKSISVIDASGIALTAIKGLHAIVKEKDAKIDRLERELNAIKKKLGM